MTPVPSPRPNSNEMAYFQAVEAHFVGLRGHPLVLSPDDWHLAQTWRQRGIPLRVVLRALTTVFERRRQNDRAKTIQSLSYCRHEVEREFARHGQAAVGAAAPAAEPTVPPARRLRNHSRTLESAIAGWPVSVRMQGKRAVVELQRLAVEMELHPRPVQETENDLLDLEERLLRDLKKGMPPEHLADLKAKCAARLAPFHPKMTGEVYLKTLEHALASEIRALFHLPFLSLLTL